MEIPPIEIFTVEFPLPTSAAKWHLPGIQPETPKDHGLGTKKHKPLWWKGIIVV